MEDYKAKPTIKGSNRASADVFRPNELKQAKKQASRFTIKSEEITLYITKAGAIYKVSLTNKIGIEYIAFVFAYPQEECQRISLEFGEYMKLHPPFAPVRNFDRLSDKKDVYYSTGKAYDVYMYLEKTEQSEEIGSILQNEGCNSGATIQPGSVPCLELLIGRLLKQGRCHDRVTLGPAANLRESPVLYFLEHVIEQQKQYEKPK